MSNFDRNPSERATPLERSRRLAAIAIVALAVSACGGGGGGGGPVGIAPTPTPTSSGGGPVTNQSAYTCDGSDTPSSVARRGGSGRLVRRMPLRGSVAASTAHDTGLVAVTYARTFAHGSRALMESRERIAGASLTREIDHPHIGKVTRVLVVPLAARAATVARLRAQSGVLSVTTTGARRHAFGSTAYFSNDPYFTGFPQETGSDGTIFPQTINIGPYYEAANVEGQWDMHAIGLEHAFGYSVNGSSGAFNANAIGSPGVKLAVIDSGEDTNNDDLGSKIVYQRCFITNSDGAQSTSNFTTDQNGHGTAVSGIAAADFNNGLGFVGSGGATSIYGYRVDPTPDDNCATEAAAANDDQCGASTVDIASAVEDAVTQNVNVINLSLGADPCVNGQDSDTTEGNAIADAIAAKIVVVAAAGNDGVKTQAVASPACDPGVIAAGASALDDGTTDGSAHTGGSAQTPTEYVPSYSQYGSPASAYRSTSAWGIVAPGGDPTDGNDADNFHWIENDYTTTPLDDKFAAGGCYADYPSTSNATDAANCHILIAGTSMASPSVAGSAALIIAANPTYQSPAMMKQLFCSTTDDIGDPHEGCGRLNVYRAMATALNDPNKP